MTKFTEALVSGCQQELAVFSDGQFTETDDPQYRRIGEYWQSIGKDLDGRTVVKGKRPAWSAAFISFVVRNAGADALFRYAEAHCHYVVKAVADRKAGVAETAYWGHEPSRYAPRVGDLVCGGREYALDFGLQEALLTYEADSFFPSHCDVVVEVDTASRRIHVIGGNVGDSVSLRRYRIDDNGRLLPRVDLAGKSHPWIAVLSARI